MCEILLRLADTTTQLTGGSPVAVLMDNGSAHLTAAFAAQVLTYIQSTGRQRPDAVQEVLQEVDIRPTFYYADAAVCVFCDEAPPSADETGAVRS